MSSAPFNWTFAGAPVSVELDLGFVERLRRHVRRAPDRDHCGVLLGSVTVDSPLRVRVTGFLPASQNGIPAALRQCAGDCVGYYRFPGDGRIRLGPGDISLATRSFRDPANVFLVGRREPSGEVAAGLFFWDEGRIHSDFSFLEFPLSAESLREPRASAARRLPWAFAAVAVVSLLALAALLVPSRRPPPVRSGEALGLRYELRGSQVRVAWNSIPDARAGVLSIREDGRDTRVPLSPDQLRTAAVFYPRTGGETLRFHLEVQDAASRSVAEDLAVWAPPLPHAAKPSRARPAPEPPRSFDPPALPAVATPRPELGDLPAITLPAAAGPALTPLAPAPVPPPIAVPTVVKDPVYTPPKPITVLRPTLPSTIAAVIRTRTRIQVKVSLDGNGSVIAAQPVASDGKSPVVESLVLSAARFWKFEPARRDGVPVPGEVVVNVDFEPGGK